nr:glycogen debranching protein GlgX [Ardenticatenales bacterium]
MTTQPATGQSYPLGANIRPDGVNFSLFSKHATAVELLLFDHAEASRPTRVIRLDPTTNRTFYYWHTFVPDLRAGQLYGFRAHGPYIPEEGQRFDPSKVLLDPYSRAVMYGDNYSREAATHVGYDNCAEAMKSVVVDPRGYDWEGDMPLQRPFSELIVYEMHVGGFTRHASSGVAPARRGTYAGLIEKIPYLQSLGVTAVELLPVQQFDEYDVPNPLLRNYWGYSPVSFFAPHRGYSSQQDPLGPVYEFREMVKALHRAGIEVILDVVFNHTAEGDHSGPTFCYKGLSNRGYYILSNQRGYYDNYSGCGNTFKCNHSISRRLIMECLHYWVQVMHVDGFRFDLASVMARDEEGRPLASPPILWEIESDPVLAGTKIIAEAWDAAGLYQVGSFVGHRWAEWNAPYRDDVRRYLKSDPGTIRAVAARIAGSRDMYPELDRAPDRSINFVTCHDGFTLNDMVSYNVKHNLANGEDNRDGATDNFSWNCGEEGTTNDPKVRALRARQIKNALTLLFISQGTPMLLMGDEVRRTQHGNNNGYCQDNELGWFNWEDLEQEAELLRFVQGLIRFHLRYRLFRDERFWEDHTVTHPPIV